MTKKKMPSALTILKKAKGFVEAGWCQQTMSEDKNGTPLGDPFSRKAKRFCAMGALQKATGREAFRSVKKYNPELYARFNKARSTLDTAATNEGIVSFNDDPVREKSDVIRAFDRAIYILQGEAKE